MIGRVLALAGFATACATSRAAMATDGAADRDAVRASVVGVVHDIDAKRWTELRARYAAEVEVDYTSLFGGEPQRQTADALIGGWRGALAHVATQHLLGPIEVEISGARATAHCHVRAMHHAAKAAGGPHWEVLGHYVFEIAREQTGWKITRMKLETLLQTGNAKLLAEAGAQ